MDSSFKTKNDPVVEMRFCSLSLWFFFSGTQLFSPKPPLKVAAIFFLFPSFCAQNAIAVIQFSQLLLLYFYNNVLIDTHYHVRNRALNNKLNTLVNECYNIF